MTAEAFGSFTNDLATWHSDLDMVVTGLAVPDRITGGYDRSERSAIAHYLEKIVQQLRRHSKFEIAKVCAACCSVACSVQFALVRGYCKDAVAKLKIDVAFCIISALSSTLTVYEPAARLLRT